VDLGKYREALLRRGVLETVEGGSMNKKDNYIPPYIRLVPDVVDDYVARYKRAVKDIREVDSIRGMLASRAILREVEEEGLMDKFVAKMEEKEDE